LFAEIPDLEEFDEAVVAASLSLVDQCLELAAK